MCIGYLVPDPQMMLYVTWCTHQYLEGVGRVPKHLLRIPKERLAVYWKPTPLGQVCYDCRHISDLVACFLFAATDLEVGIRNFFRLNLDSLFIVLQIPYVAYRATFGRLGLRPWCSGVARPRQPRRCLSHG